MIYLNDLKQQVFGVCHQSRVPLVLILFKLLLIIVSFIDFRGVYDERTDLVVPVENVNIVG